MEKGNRKRKPLSDITNTYNLIPTPDLANLVGASTNSGPYSKPRPLVLNPSSVLSNKKLRSGLSNRPGTGIGSPHVTGARNSRPVQLRTPPRAISSIARQGDRISKDRRHTRKQSEEITKERDAAVEKKKNKGSTAFAPFSSSSPDNTKKDNQNELLNTSSLPEREKQKGSAYRNLFGGSVEMVEESNKLTPNSSSHLYEKANKAKGIVDYSSFSLEKAIDGEKSGSSGDGKGGIFKQSGPSILKTKEIGKEIVDPLSSLAERINEKEKPLNPVGSSIERTREKGKAVMELPEIVEPTKSKRYSAAEKGKAVMQLPETVEVTKSKWYSAAENLKPLNTVDFSIERTREKGKAVMQSPEIVDVTKSKSYSAAEKEKPLNPVGSSIERTRDKGMAVMQPPGIVEVTKSKRYSAAEKGKAVMQLPEVVEVTKSKRYSAAEKGKAVMQLPENVEVTKSKMYSAAENEKLLNTVDSSIERTREKGKAVMQSPEIVEVIKYKRYSAAAKVNTRSSNRRSTKRKIDAGVASCPPMTRSRNLKIDLAGDLKSSKPWTDAPPKSKKKSRLNNTKELPLEFVEQQNAYYKEIDAFELQEEEVSEDELD